MPELATSGLLELDFARAPDGRTVLSRRSQRFPLRITVPLYLDPSDPGMAFVYVQNPTGAVFPGDELDVVLRAAEGARVHLTTQSATKVAQADGVAARQRTAIAIATGAVVESIPDLLIPQAGALYDQDTVVALEPGGVFMGAELLAPGRLARGEAFAYARVRLRTTVLVDGEELVHDALAFEPTRYPPGALGALGGHGYVGTLLVAGDALAPDKLAARLDEALAAGSTLAAAGVLPRGRGVAVRVLAPSAAEARQLLDTSWALVRDEVLGLPLPPRRK